jgi:hypothetical protein
MPPLGGRVQAELNTNFVAVVYPVQIQSSNRLPHDT